MWMILKSKLWNLNSNKLEFKLVGRYYLTNVSMFNSGLLNNISLLRFSSLKYLIMYLTIIKTSISIDLYFCRKKSASSKLRQWFSSKLLNFLIETIFYWIQRFYSRLSLYNLFFIERIHDRSSLSSPFGLREVTSPKFVLISGCFGLGGWFA